MSMYPQYKSKSGYYINNDGIDSYGVNHKNFSTRDELEYQFARVDKEKQKINDYNKQNDESSNTVPRYWDTASDGKKVYDYVVQKEGYFQPREQNVFSYDYAALNGLYDMTRSYFQLKNNDITDKYKHAYMNCVAAQYGKGGTDMARIVSGLGEINDIVRGTNTIDSSQGDNYANKIGRLLGGKYPQVECDEMVRRYINKYYKDNI